ncbi:hypothetical protein Lser_V15G32210 [Lactuca serriola]
MEHFEVHGAFEINMKYLEVHGASGINMDHLELEWSINDASCIMMCCYYTKRATYDQCAPLWC